MVKKMRFVTEIGIGSVALLLTGAAFGQETGFYLNADIGPAWREQVNIKRFLNVPNAGHFGFDTGVRFDLAAGYQFLPWLAAEFETGFIYNYIEHEQDSWLANYPFMVNVVVKKQLFDRITPFAGVGAGGVGSTLRADDLVRVQGNTLTVIHGEDSDVVFGWQGFIGTRFSINDRWNVSLTYRYLWADESGWDVRSGGFTGFRMRDDRIEIGSTETHSVVVGVTFRF